MRLRRSSCIRSSLWRSFNWPKIRKSCRRSMYLICSLWNATTLSLKLTSDQSLIWTTNPCTFSKHSKVPSSMSPTSIWRENQAHSLMTLTTNYPTLCFSSWLEHRTSTSVHEKYGPSRRHSSVQDASCLYPSTSSSSGSDPSFSHVTSIWKTMTLRSNWYLKSFWPSLSSSTNNLKTSSLMKSMALAA